MEGSCATEESLDKALPQVPPKESRQRRRSEVVWMQTIRMQRPTAKAYHLALIWCFLRFEIDFLHKHAGCSLSGRLKAQVGVPIVKCRWRVIIHHPEQRCSSRAWAKSQTLGFPCHPKNGKPKTVVVALLVKCHQHSVAGKAACHRLTELEAIQASTARASAVSQ